MSKSSEQQQNYQQESDFPMSAAGQLRSSSRVDLDRLQTIPPSQSSSSVSSVQQYYGNQPGVVYQNQYDTGYGVGHHSNGRRRHGHYQRQVIRLPDQPGQCRQVRHRLPTPEPDILERVYVRRAANEIVEEITEVPMTPPPRIQERTVVEPSGPPQVVRRVVRVPPRSGRYVSQQQYYRPSYTPASSQVNLISTASFASVQPCAGCPPPPCVSAPPVINVSSPYVSSNYGTYGGGYIQPSFGYSGSYIAQPSIAPSGYYQRPYYYA